MATSSELVLVVVRIDVSLVKLERDRMVRDGEGELAEGAVTILPPGVGLLEEIVCHGLDDLVWCSAHEAYGQIIEYYFAHLDRCRGQRDLLIVRGESR